MRSIQINFSGGGVLSMKVPFKLPKVKSPLWFSLKVKNLPKQVRELRRLFGGTIEFAHMMGLEVCTTPYYSPESNRMAESFEKTFKRDYVSMHDLPDPKTVMACLHGLKIIIYIIPIRGP
jgi:hypothetical protein